MQPPPNERGGLKVSDTLKKIEKAVAALAKQQEAICEKLDGLAERVASLPASAQGASVEEVIGF